MKTQYDPNLTVPPEIMQAAYLIDRWFKSEGGTDGFYAIGPLCSRKHFEQLKAIRSELLNAVTLAKATIERLQRHAPGSANGTLDVIRAAISYAKALDPENTTSEPAPR